MSGHRSHRQGRRQVAQLAFQREAARFLEGIGYASRDVVRDYRYTICAESGALEPRQVALVSFGGAQRNMRTACVTAFEAASEDAALTELKSLRFLAAPASIVAMNGTVSLYAVHSTKEPVVIDSLDRREWQSRLLPRTEYLSPQSLMAAKRGDRAGPFLDARLFAWAEDVTERTLSSLLESVYATLWASLPSNRRRAKAGQAATLQLLFRLLAVRVLEDRERVEVQEDVWRAIANAEEKLSLSDAHGLSDLSSQFPTNETAAALRGMRERFSFDSLTPETLAYAYENALVSKQARAELGIYYTPRAITRFVLDHLPLESIPQAKRAVLDPCCGSGSFLLAAHERLNAMLPSDWTPRQRHRYLAQRIAGMDVDPFARETARLALVLAGIDVGDGWQIREGDAMKPMPSDFARQPTVIVTNPPFREIKVAGTRREVAAEILGNLLRGLPMGGYVGIVVPQSVLESEAAASVRRELLNTCTLLEIATFPGSLFESNAETAVLLARREAGGSSRSTVVTIRECSGRDVAEFRRSRKFSTTYSVVADEWSADEKARFVASPFFDLWARLNDSCVPLDEVAHITNGLQVKPDDHDSVSSQAAPGLVPYVERVGATMAPFVFLADGEIAQPKFLRYGEQLHRQRAPENFEAAKVLISSNRNPAYTWRLVAASAPAGVYYSENFQGLRPKAGNIGPGALTAILNGHVANAWFHAHCRKRKIVLRILKRLPVPRLDALTSERLEKRVAALADLLKRIHERRAQTGHAPLFWSQDAEGERIEELMEEAALLLGEIDGVVLDAYGVSERDRLALVRYMGVDKRPSLF